MDIDLDKHKEEAMTCQLCPNPVADEEEICEDCWFSIEQTALEAVVEDLMAESSIRG